MDAVFCKARLIFPRINDPIVAIAWPYPLYILSDCQCSFSLPSKRFRSSYCMVRKLEWGQNNGGRERGRGEGETFFLVYPSPLCSFSLLSFPSFELLLLKRNKNHVCICRWQQLQKSPCHVCNVGGERWMQKKSGIHDSLLQKELQSVLRKK